MKNTFSKNIMELRYSWDKSDGTKETWEDIAERVVRNVFSVVEFASKEEIIKELIQIISERKFIPGGRFLAQAGRPYHQTNNCFLLRAEDTREGWGSLLDKATRMLMAGGGIGVDYSNLRPSGSVLKRSGGVSSGPLPLMKTVNEVGRGVMAGGKRRCLPTGTLVETENGIKPIEMVNIGDLIKTSKGMFPVVEKVNQGIQETIIVKTQNGRLECTPNHELAIFTDIYSYKFVKASDLKPGDRLVFSQAKLEINNNSKLPNYCPTVSSHATTVKNITIPELDENIAWLFGIIHGNGNIKMVNMGKGKRNGHVSISLSKQYPKSLEKAKNQLERFGVNVGVKEYAGYWVLRVASVQLTEYFSQFKTANQSLNVPDFIWNSSGNIRAAYLAGLFDADGSCKTRPLNMVTSVYPEFLEQIQYLISSLGIASRIKLRRPAKDNWKDMWVVNIATRKQVQLVEEIIMCFSTKYIPRIIKNAQFSYSFTPNMIIGSFDKLPKSIKNRKANYSSDYVYELSNVNSNILPIEVFGIEKGRLIETWDIEVEKVNEFTVNGYVVHNSAIWSGLRWDHADIDEFITCKNWIPEVRKLKEKDFDFPAPMDMTNISVILDKDFFDAYSKPSNSKHQLAQDVYWKVIDRMLKTAEPGFSVDFNNPKESLRNACCEIVSEDDSDVCCLGSVNFSKIENAEELKHVTELAQLFLIVGTEYSDAPVEKVKEIRNKNRRTGVGIMGIHSWLIQHGYKYDENPELATWLQTWKNASDYSAKYWSRVLSFNEPIAKRAIAPSGSISIAGGETTSGIEPVFSVAYQRRYLTPDGWKKQYVVDFVAEDLYAQGFNPNDIEDAYSLSFDVERRIKFQSFVQSYTDNAISSTVNLPAWGTPGNDDPKSFGDILMKYLPSLRGITVYPDGARGGQPLVPVEFEYAISRKGVVFEGNEECSNGVCGV